MGKLTTHVLDIVHGKPARKMFFSLLREGDALVSGLTNDEGRSPSPLLDGEDLTPGSYELRFRVGEYFEGLGVECPFLDVVPVWFRVEEGKSYHVPLVVSPWAYSTYRGS